MDALGRVLDIVPTAAGEWISLKNGSAVTFVCVGAEAFTVSEAADAAGTGAANLKAIDHWYANANADGSTGWTEQTTTTNDGATITPPASVGVFTISASQLSDGAAYVRCSKTTAGLVTAIVHDLTAERAPELLPALGA